MRGHMGELLKEIIKQVENGNVIVLFVLVLIALFINAQKIVDFYEAKKRHRIEKLKEALDNNFVRSLSKEYLEKEIEAEYFRLTTGIYLEREFREKILSIHQQAKGELSFSHFRRALPHLVFEKGEIQVSISRTDKFSFWFGLIVGWFFIACSMIFFMSSIYIKQFDLLHFIVFISFCIFFLLAGGIMIRQTFPVRSAEIIAKHLEKVKS
jgi:hypothetical protein